jgi:diguanylate cyclase (GGDEF)-like protein
MNPDRSPSNRSPTIVGPIGMLSWFAVAGTPRFRASQRARLRDSSRIGMGLAVGIAALDCAWLIPVHPDAVALILGINAAVVIAAVIGWIALATLARRRPELPVLAVLLVADAATVVLGVGHPALGLVAIAYLLLLPTIVAPIPWSTRIHVAWLALHTATTLAYVGIAPDGALPGTLLDRFLGVMGLVVLSSAVSQFGHLNALRARVLSFVQIERIRALNREARRDQIRVDRLNRILEETARTDELTGLKNRLSLKLDLAVIRSRIARHHELYALFMLDLDRFKAVNDRLGHVAGDDVLRAVARSFDWSVRPDDAVYRYGGEEILVLARVERPSQAMVAADRIRLGIEALHLPHPGNPPYDCVTVSVGVTVIGEEDLQTDDAAWISRVDAALYRAKTNGRNRCEGEFVRDARRPRSIDGRRSALIQRR